mgnify:CR=1 FL=1
MEIKLNVYCNEDLEAQAKLILRELENGKSYKEIKENIEHSVLKRLKNEM